MNFIGNAVGQLLWRPLSASLDHPVTFLASAATSPRPTITCLINIPPEPNIKRRMVLFTTFWRPVLSKSLIVLIAQTFCLKNTTTTINRANPIHPVRSRVVLCAATLLVSLVMLAAHPTRTSFADAPIYRTLRHKKCPRELLREHFIRFLKNQASYPPLRSEIFASAFGARTAKAQSAVTSTRSLSPVLPSCSVRKPSR